LSKGQAATELIVILAVVLALLGAALFFYSDINNSFSQQFQINKAKIVVADLSSAAQSVYQQGEEARTRVLVSFPSEAKAINFSDESISLELNSGRKAYRYLGLPLTGTLSLSPGEHWVFVESTANGVSFNEEISFFSTLKSFNSLYLINSGSDVSDGSSRALTPAELTYLSADDSSLITTDDYWPKNNLGYDENKYLEFIFDPQLTAENITQVLLYHTYQITASKEIAAKFELWNGSSWINQSLTVPSVKDTDHAQVLNLTSMINSVNSLNEFKLRFLAYVVPNFNLKTRHDYLALNVTYEQ